MKKKKVTIKMVMSIIMMLVVSFIGAVLITVACDHVWVSAQKVREKYALEKSVSLSEYMESSMDQKFPVWETVDTPTPEPTPTPELANNSSHISLIQVCMWIVMLVVPLLVAALCVSSLVLSLTN